VSKNRRPHRQPAGHDRAGHPAELVHPAPPLPDDVTPELVTALAAMSRLGDAWHEYNAAMVAAASAARRDASSLSQATRRFDRVEQMLPATPGAAIDAAGHNALILAAMTAAANAPIR